MAGIIRREMRKKEKGKGKKEEKRKRERRRQRKRNRIQNIKIKGLLLSPRFSLHWLLVPQCHEWIQTPRFLQAGCLPCLGLFPVMAESPMVNLPIL